MQCSQQVPPLVTDQHLIAQVQQSNAGSSRQRDEQQNHARRSNPVAIARTRASRAGER